MDGQICGKPGTVDVARTRWQAMAGREGVLHTGHAVVRVRDGRPGHVASQAAATTVRFGVPTDSEIAAYLTTGEPLAVAGAFTLDGLGGWFVDGIDGDPSNVIGISLPLLRRMLGGVGVSVAELWSF
jgi:septum formation protein